MKNLLIILTVSLFTFTSTAQHTNILIDDIGGAGFAPEEPSIIINPKNTDHLVAGSNISNCYRSVDGGLTWSRETLSSTYGVWGDPVLIVDTAGSYYFFHLSNPDVGSWIDRIVCQKLDSIDGIWDNGSYMGLNGSKEQDKEWAAVDRANNNIYVTWTQFDNYNSPSPNDFSNIHFSKSTDGGATWTEALQINEVSGDCLDDDNTTEGAVPAIGPSGEVYVAWAGPEGLVFDYSLDQGDTWLEEDIFICDIPGGWAYDIPGIYRANGLPVTLCDTSGGPNHGTIYVNWTDQRNGEDDTDVWFVKSVDGGESWSDPLRVNDDPPGSHQFFTWMAIDQTSGNLYFVFYDRRNYINSNTDVYMARSTDGGETIENFKVSDSPFLPNSNVFFGDYTNVTAHDDVVRPIWARLQGGELSVWTALVDLPFVGLEEPVDYTPVAALEQNYPNPFSGKTYFSFKLREETETTLRVFDQYGRLVYTLLENTMMGPGKYLEELNADEAGLVPGIYYFSLIAGREVSKRKMIVL